MDILALLNLIQEKIAKDTGESKEMISVREYVPPFRAYLVDTDDATWCVSVNGSEVTLLPLEKDSHNITWEISTGQKDEGLTRQLNDILKELEEEVRKENDTSYRYAVGLIQRLLTRMGFSHQFTPDQQVQIRRILGTWDQLTRA